MFSDRDLDNIEYLANKELEEIKKLKGKRSYYNSERKKMYEELTELVEKARKM